MIRHYPHRAAFAAIGVAGASLFLLSATTAQAQGGRRLSTELTGAAEVPGPGDPTGSGFAEFVINPGHLTVCYEVTYDVFGTLSGAHIHEAPVDAAGPIVVPLDSTVDDGFLSDCADVTRDLAVAIISDPSAYYVNVHSLPGFGPGAVRGQLGQATGQP